MLPLDPDHARHWLSERLARPLAELPGDIPHRQPSHTRPAAVLVPLLWHPGQPTILLTRREAGLRHHAGQISFPGGKQEADDASACAAALREAHEEIGLAPERVTVVGELPAYVTVTGFCVTPVVGLILPPVRLTAQVGEVAEIFELPLPLALNPANYIRHDYQQEGRREDRKQADQATKPAGGCLVHRSTEKRREGEQRARDGLRGTVACQKCVIADPARRHHFGLQQR